MRVNIKSYIKLLNKFALTYADFANCYEMVQNSEVIEKSRFIKQIKNLESCKKELVKRRFFLGFKPELNFLNERFCVNGDFVLDKTFISTDDDALIKLVQPYFRADDAFKPTIELSEEDLTKIEIGCLLLALRQERGK